MTRARKAAATTKGAAKSKLMWLGLAVLVMGELQRASALGELIPEHWRGVVLEVLGLAIMVARFFTTESLSDKGASSDETSNG